MARAHTRSNTQVAPFGLVPIMQRSVAGNRYQGASQRRRRSEDQLPAAASG